MKFACFNERTVSSLLFVTAGFVLLTGRLAVREGVRVVLGCFVLLGAPVIAGAFLGVGEEAGGGTNVDVAQPALPMEREELAPSTYDPYAGASVRDDR